MFPLLHLRRIRMPVQHVRPNRNEIRGGAGRSELDGERGILESPTRRRAACVAAVAQVSLDIVSLIVAAAIDQGRPDDFPERTESKSRDLMLRHFDHRRQSEVKRGAALRAAGEPKASSVSIDDRVADRQPDPHA